MEKMLVSKAKKCMLMHLHKVGMPTQKPPARITPNGKKNALNIIECKCSL